VAKGHRSIVTWRHAECSATVRRCVCVCVCVCGRVDAAGTYVMTMTMQAADGDTEAAAMGLRDDTGI